MTSGGDELPVFRRPERRSNTRGVKGWRLATNSVDRCASLRQRRLCPTIYPDFTGPSLQKARLKISSSAPVRSLTPDLPIVACEPFLVSIYIQRRSCAPINLPSVHMYGPSPTKSTKPVRSPG